MTENLVDQKKPSQAPPGPGNMTDALPPVLPGQLEENCAEHPEPRPQAEIEIGDEAGRDAENRQPEREIPVFGLEETSQCLTGQLDPPQCFPARVHGELALSSIACPR